MNSLLPNEEDLFDAARRISDAGDLAAFLESSCSGDHGLRQRIERMLGVREQAELLFRPHANQIHPVSAGAVIGTPAGDASGGQIGRYTLREKLGEGGFGVVYLAEQAEPVGRQVALKIIKLGMDTRQFVARFEAERQAPALLDHPNIAKVFDVGAIHQHSPELAPGRPYFVMEPVRGMPITRHCKDGPLSLEERLGLFLQVCEAAQHAHQKGVIHRDLKPSNILVTVLDRKPVPKVTTSP